MTVIGKKITAVIFVIGLCYTCPAFCAGTAIDILMPGTMFGPGSPFSIDLKITNSGPEVPDAMLFVALSLGADDFWFFPGWVHYPPSIDWQEIDIRANSEKTWPVIRPVSWPSSCGEFNDAIIYAMIFYNGELVSNLAETPFGWSESPQPTSTPTFTPTMTPTPLEPDSTPSPTFPPAGPEGFVFLPPGDFQMGSYSSYVPCRLDKDKTYESMHNVTLTQGFFIQQTEITRHMWVDLASRQPTLPPDPSSAKISPGTDYPVEFVTWFETILYANLLSLDQGFEPCYFTDETFTVAVDASNYRDGSVYCNFNANGYRLPTDAEWEYACRAGTESVFCCPEINYGWDCYSCMPGNLPILEEHCVFCTNSGGSTQPARSKRPNNWNLYDFHGNVWEWVWDVFETVGTSAVTDPAGPVTGSCRVYRGGAWNTDAANCRSAMRHGSNPGNRYDNIGFRLVKGYVE